MLEVRNIVVLYGKNYAVHGVSLEVKEGEIISLIGANGSGKSTMLAAIAGLARCSAGEIQFQGKDITNLGCHETVAMGIGYVPEGRHLFQAMSVMENLLLGAQFPRNRKTFKQNLQRAFGHFPILATRKKQLAGTLSGGEAQMLAIARGLMTDPRLLLLDEPVSSVDSSVEKDVFEIFGAEKSHCLKQIEHSRQLTEQLHKSNMETILLSGRRIGLSADVPGLYQKMIVIDEICRLVWGRMPVALVSELQGQDAVSFLFEKEPSRQ